jgi:hypothetical protein
MLFQLHLDRRVDSFEPLEAAIRARDPFASISLDPDSGRIRVAGQISAAQALAAFSEAGFSAEQVTDLGAGASAHGNGGGCCGSCSGG